MVPKPTDISDPAPASDPRSPTEPRRASRGARDALIAIGAGLAASAVTGVVDRLLDPFVSTEQKLREKLVRSGSPHDVVGPVVARKLLAHEPDHAQEATARAAFGIVYGLAWGLLYGWVRRAVPAASRAGGMPFALPFYLACDGVIAPLLGLSPPITRVPWQLDAKELANHVAWTATAEAVHRSAQKLGL